MKTVPLLLAFLVLFGGRPGFSSAKNYTAVEGENFEATSSPSVNIKPSNGPNVSTTVHNVTTTTKQPSLNGRLTENHLYEEVPDQINSAAIYSLISPHEAQSQMENQPQDKAYSEVHFTSNSDALQCQSGEVQNVLYSTITSPQP
ncbi:hypothetical protein WMY93_014830 [Mugilogobius chulae]|uniref:Uncharacterized protein n=1 Tax=Mugilogobius chulae TaxID=88201 RepID=A0AAW0P033_9GOBI